MQVFKQCLTFLGQGSTAIWFDCLTTFNNLNLLVHINKKNEK